MVSRILSGMRPTGRLHIGHLVGALNNWVDLQDQYDSFYFVADWHALTTETDTRNIQSDSFEMVKDWLAAGIDPEKSTLFIQSQVPQHAELHLIFSMLNTLPRLERLPTYKAQLIEVLNKKDPESELTLEEIAKAKSQISLGFLGYPVLQAADILVYKADGVPVGEDQVPHVELTREIARTFNRNYGKVFPEPEALLTNTPRILGTDGRKMGKSYGNAVLPTDSLEIISSGVSKMVTDPVRIKLTDPGEDPYSCSVYGLHQAYSAENRQMEIFQECRKAEIGCKDCKLEASQRVHETYKDYTEKRNALEGKEDYIREILMEGSKQAKKVTSQTLKEVREALLFNY